MTCRSMSTSNEQEQRDELEALASIYDLTEGCDGHVTFVAHQGDQYPGGTAVVTCMLPTDFAVEVTGIIGTQRHPLAHLPPVTLNFHFPPAYPQSGIPEFTLTCPWLTPTRLLTVADRLRSLAAERPGEVLLFEWISFLREDLLAALDLQNFLPVHAVPVLEKATEEAASAEPGGCLSRQQRKMLRMLIEYDAAQAQRQFDTTLFDCNICYDTKRGLDCVKFELCGHIFCREDIQHYITAQVEQGEVDSLTCPNPDCKVEILQSEIARAVPPDLYQKYEQILLTRALDRMEDVLYCPRCNARVVAELDRNLGLCPACHLSFCTLCKATYHFPNPCAISNIKEVLLLYKDGTVEEKAALQKRYGVKTLQRLYLESMTALYIQSTSNPCPTCRAPVTKIEGCNKMVCSACKTPFCWLCLRPISNSDPYGHFRGNGACNGRLFDGIELADGDDEDDLEDPMLFLE